jgi:hypothetical protein
MSFDVQSTAAVSQPHWNVHCDGGNRAVPCFDFSTGKFHFSNCKTVDT